MEINSYILKPGHEVVPLKTYDDFINVKDSEKLLEIEDNLDDFYLDGAIEIKYKEQLLLDLDDWDLIDQLWSYILNLIAMKVFFIVIPNAIYTAQVVGMVIYTTAGFILNKYWSMK